MDAYVATKNAGKLGELREIFAASPLRLKTYDAYADVEETGDSYAGNALLKANALAAQLRDAGIHAPVLADDSGLEVAELGGRPGIYSARYAGAGATWPQRRALLLEELRGFPEERRGARFVCTMAFVDGASVETIVEGTVEGFITEEERGGGGFGYDPVFFYPALRCTFAELEPGVKNALSHRGAAARALLEALQPLLF